MHLSKLVAAVVILMSSMFILVFTIGGHELSPELRAIATLFGTCMFADGLDRYMTYQRNRKSVSPRGDT